MKPPLQALLIAKEWKGVVISGRKRISIREGHRDYRQGPVMLCCNLENWALMADIVSVRHCVFSEVTAEEFQADGFKTRRELLDALLKYYPNISLDSFVTIICWKYARGKLVDTYRAKHAKKEAK